MEFIPSMTAARATILHVEDDPNDAMLFQHACRKAGVDFELHAVQDGDVALAYLSGAEDFADRQKHPLPQLILLDLKMPRVSGFDVLSRIRTERPLQSIPVIVLTSSSHESDIKKAYDLGANSYVVKPVSFDALVDVVKTIQGYWITFNQGL